MSEVVKQAQSHSPRSLDLKHGFSLALVVSIVAILVNSVPADGAIAYEKFISRAIAEKGVEDYSKVDPRIDEVDVLNYHFPKKSIPGKIEYAPKWEQNRYRNYKTRPETPMRHLLKAPSAPIALTLRMHLRGNEKFSREVTVSWDTPYTDGSSPITGFEISQDDGLSWSDVAGGGETRNCTLRGLEKGQQLSVMLRAKNKVGTGPFASVAGTAAKLPGRRQLAARSAVATPPLVKLAPRPAVQVHGAETGAGGDEEVDEEGEEEEAGEEEESGSVEEDVGDVEAEDDEEEEAEDAVEA